MKILDLDTEIASLQKRLERDLMSDQKIEALEVGLYEDYLEELQKKYYGGINKAF